MGSYRPTGSLEPHPENGPNPKEAGHPQPQPGHSQATGPGWLGCPWLPLRCHRWACWAWPWQSGSRCLFLCQSRSEPGAARPSASGWQGSSHRRVSASVLGVSLCAGGQCLCWRSASPCWGSVSVLGVSVCAGGQHLCSGSCICALGGSAGTGTAVGEEEVEGGKQEGQVEIGSQSLVSLLWGDPTLCPQAQQTDQPCLAPGALASPAATTPGPPELAAYSPGPADLPPVCSALGLVLGLKGKRLGDPKAP